MAIIGLKEIEQRIGHEPFSGDLTKTYIFDRLQYKPTERETLSLKADLRLWLQKQGLPQAFINRATNGTLASMYAIKPYFRKVRQKENPSWALLNGDDDDGDILAPAPAQPPVQPRPAQASDVSEAWVKTLFAQMETSASKLVDAKAQALQNEIDVRFANMGLSPKVRSEIEQAVAAAIANGLPPREITVRPQADAPAINVGQQHAMFPKLLRVMNARDHKGHRLNVWITGPTGSGKTSAVEASARALFSTKKPDPALMERYGVTDDMLRSITLKAGATQNFGQGASDSEDAPAEAEYKLGADGSLDADYKVLGFKDGHGTFHWTPFLLCFAFGYPYCADEIDNWMPGPLLAINAPLANGFVSTPIGMIQRHPDFIIIACANTWGLGANNDYVGRSRLDAATLNRFLPKLSWDYDEKLELALALNFDPGFAKPWHDVILQARAGAKRQGTKIIISPRDTLFGISLLREGFTYSEVVDMTFGAGLTPEQLKALALVLPRDVPQGAPSLDRFAPSFDITDNDFDRALIEAWAENGKVGAIRVYREHTGCDLATAKEAVEARFVEILT